jgi:signal transduction histidine kinase
MNDTELIASPQTEQALLNAASTAFAERPGPGSDTVAALAHDARNLITALGLYCDLLEEPGVLAQPFTHYGNELRLVAAAGRRLVSKLAVQSERSIAPASAAFTAAPIASAPFEIPREASNPIPSPAASPLRRRPEYARFDDEFAATPITNLAAELLANRNLLAALAGSGIAVTVDLEGGAHGIPLTAEDLTRILVNLVRNAAEAMTSGTSTRGGRIQISLSEIAPAGQVSPVGAPVRLRLVFEDNGPGISPVLLEKVFDRGFTTHASAHSGENWTTIHRGLGLAISRSIIESAGGRIQVASRPGGGARFIIELPAL